MLRKGDPLFCDRYLKEIEIRIASDREKGASQLYLDALKILKKWMEDEHNDGECLKKMLACIVRGQPSMAPMLNLANNVLLALDEGFDRAKEYVDREIEDFARRLDRVIDVAVDFLSQYKKFATVSYSSTVISVMSRMAERGKVSLWVSKGDPVPFGLRLADELFDSGVETVVTTDALLPYFVRKVDAVVVGADSVDEAGLVNGAGTFALALAAARYGIPFYVVCGTEKFLPTLLSRYHVIRDEPFPLKLSKGHGIAYRIFDLTPPDLITAFITEKGVMGQEEFKEFVSSLKVSPQFHYILD